LDGQSVASYPPSENEEGPCAHVRADGSTKNGDIEMAYNHQVADRIRAHLTNQSGRTEKEMFGGIGFFIHGNMACGVIDDELVVRVGTSAYEDALEAASTRPFDFTGRPMKGWVTVQRDGFDSEPELAGWVDRGVEFARTLPRKKAS
jgi:TfoX/Sxy family transcriptional regulator of competence genes